MTNVEFQGDIEIFSEPQLTLIRSVLKKHDFDNGIAQVETVGKKGDNYIAFIKRITVKKDEENHFKMIAKIAPENEKTRNIMHTKMMFKNEIVMYSEVLPLYNELLNEESVASGQRLRSPICYGYISEAPREIILLEDLQESNFGILNRFISLSNESVKLVLKEMAIFHSLAYVLRKKRTEKFNEIKHKLINFWGFMAKIPQAKITMHQLEEDIMLILDNEKYKNVVKGTVGQLTTHAVKMYEYDITSDHSIIQQGDCSINNILFRLKDDIPVKCVMIDYQLSKIASPAADLHYFMFNCTDKEARSQFFKEWVEYYYKELEKSLIHFGLKSAIIYPREQLEADLRKHSQLSLALTILLANVLARETEDVIDVRDGATELENKNQSDIANEFRIIHANEKTLARFKAKVQGCIDTFLEFAFLS